MRSFVPFALVILSACFGYWLCSTDDVDPQMTIEWCTKEVMSSAINEGLLSGMTEEEMNETLQRVRKGCTASWEEFLEWVEEREAEQR